MSPDANGGPAVPPVTAEAEAGTLLITLRRAHDQNRVNREVLDAIGAALDRADATPSIRAIILTGEGEYFCAGGRIDGYPGGDVQAQLGFARAFTVLQERLGRASKPIIGAISGHCVAGGMSLLEACDLAIAADTAEFGYPEIEAGLFPMLAMAVARRGLPAKVAFELFYSGRRMKAEEALRHHLVTRVVPAAAVLAEARAQAARLSERSALALALGRQAFWAMAAMDPRSALEHAQTALVSMLAGTERTGAGQ